MSMYNVKSLKAEEFISDEEIRATLSYADENKNNEKLIDEILEKARLHKGLNHREASVLLACENEEKIEEMYKIKHDINYAKSTGHKSLHDKYNRYGYGYGLSMKNGKIYKNKIVDIYKN